MMSYRETETRLNLIGCFVGMHEIQAFGRPHGSSRHLVLVEGLVVSFLIFLLMLEHHVHRERLVWSGLVWLG